MLQSIIAVAHVHPDLRQHGHHRRGVFGIHAVFVNIVANAAVNGAGVHIYNAQLLGHSLAQRAFACSGRAVHGHGIYAHSSPSPLISAAAIPAARPVDQAICRLNPPV